MSSSRKVHGWAFGLARGSEYGLEGQHCCKCPGICYRTNYRGFFLGASKIYASVWLPRLALCTDLRTPERSGKGKLRPSRFHGMRGKVLPSAIGICCYSCQWEQRQDWVHFAHFPAPAPAVIHHHAAPCTVPHTLLRWGSQQWEERPC